VVVFLARQSRRYAARHPRATDCLNHVPPLSTQFVETKYHIDLNAAAASQLNRAIAHGSEKGVFLLPKGT